MLHPLAEREPHLFTRWRGVPKRPVLPVRQYHRMMQILLAVWIMAGPSLGAEMHAVPSIVPYEADFEEVVVRAQPGRTPAETRQLWKLYRDSRGRWRQETTRVLESGETARYAFLADYRAGRFVLLDVTSGQVMDERGAASPGAFRGLESLPTSPAPESNAVAQPDAVSPGIEDLGERDIEGMRAKGRRSTVGNEVTEIWSSLVIDQPPLLVRTTRPGEEVTQRMFNVRLGEPPPGLFAKLDLPAH